MIRLVSLLSTLVSCATLASFGQTEAPAAAPVTEKKVETVRAITPPRNPLPVEEESAAISKFSFLVYGDTRGRRDGKEIQYEHSLVVDSMIETIRRRSTGAFPVRFVLQTGDAVVNGRDPRQWNNSFVSLINRLTDGGGIPYFLAPGNHDVTSASELDSPNRKQGLSNYLAAIDELIPPEGAPRRLPGYPTYGFGYGNSFFIALDSNIASDEVQLAWVTEQLEKLDRNRYSHIFAFFHHPPFSSGPHGGAKIEAPAAELRKKYLPLFRKHQLDAIFAGHEHLFEHWVERYRGGSGKTLRLDHIVTGGGGAPLYGYQGDPDLRAYLEENRSEKVELEHLVKPGPKSGDNPYHYVIVEIDESRARLEVVGIDWGKDFQPYRRRAANLNDEVQY